MASQVGLSIESLRVPPASGGIEERVEIALGPVEDARATLLLEHLRAMEGTRLVTYSVASQSPTPAAGSRRSVRSEGCAGNGNPWFSRAAYLLASDKPAPVRAGSNRGR